MRSRGVIGLLAGAAVTASLALSVPAQAATPSPAQQLAERYAPVMMLKHNDDPPCSTSGEQYLPASVRILLGNPDVTLLYEPKGEKKKVVKHGATSQDIAGLDGDYYLNQRGNPYRPGCIYARDSERLTRHRSPVIYAHIARQPGYTGFSLQYWFYYWFNHFNDLHEGDWEMIQLAFPSDSVRAALSRTPSEVAYAQHGGGETASWDDSKLAKEGTHPVVYVASGSHASQYQSALYLGRGRHGLGLGCDDTRGKSFAVRPVPVLVSTYPSQGGAFGWLTYQGHWGQKARGFSNGPTGPNMKTQWLFPFTWMDDLRSSTPKMPVSEGAGVTATHFFCSAIISIAGVTNYLGNRIWLAGILLLGLVATTTLPIKRTSWRPADRDPLRQERAGGQLLRVAASLYWRYALTLVSLVLILIGLVFAWGRLAALVQSHTGLELDLNFADPGIDSFSSFVVLAPAYPIFLFLVGSPFVVAMRRIEAGERTVPWTVFREVLSLIPRLFLAELLGLGAVALLAFTVIGFPYAIKKAVDWTFAGQEIVFERKKARAAMAASTNHVRGRWWGIAAVDLALFVIGAIVGPLIGAVLIILTDAPLWTVNLTGLLVFGLTLPYMAITLTLMYLDPRHKERKARAWRRRLGHGREEHPVPVPEA
jgi:Vacuolar protein sorting-associated protein 62